MNLLRMSFLLLLTLSASITARSENRSTGTTLDNEKDGKYSEQSAIQAVHGAKHLQHHFPGFTTGIAIARDGVSHAAKTLMKPAFNHELEEARFPCVQPNLTNVIHRENNSRWSEITNMESIQSEAAIVLPATTTLTYREPKPGDLVSHNTNRFSSPNVFHLSLPDSSHTVTPSNAGRRLVGEFRFVNHELANAKSPKAGPVAAAKLHRPLPEALTSFGAAVLGEYLYVFSGHSGEAHGFGKDLLVNHFRRIKFDNPKAQWEELAMHDSAQSTALVTDGEFIYRVGGLSFLPSEDGETNFNSTDHFARYDVAKDEWKELAPLPVPRSSLDAAVVGRTVYAVGGWNLQGDSSRDAPWHDTIESFDLDNPSAGWKSLPGPGYKLRAISAAAHEGKLYVLGGMGQRGFIRKCSIFDPQTGQWSAGPELIQDNQATGFATSTFAAGGHLYSSGASGIVYRLANDGDTWEVADRLFFPRMFHRMLPLGNDRLIALGGTGFSGMGRMASVESFGVNPRSKSTAKTVSWTVPYNGKTKHSQALLLDGVRLYAFGGNHSWSPHDFSKEAFSDEAFVFDISKQSGERIPNLPFPVQSGSVVLNKQTSEHEKIVVAGGMNFGEGKFESIDSVLEFDPASETWVVNEQTLPESRAMAHAVTHDDAIWVFGGSNAGLQSQLRSSVLHWWGDHTDIAPLANVEVPHPRRSFGGVVVDGEYFMIGGLGQGMSIESAVDVFDFEDRSWRQVASPTAPRVFPMVAHAGGKIYLFGGFSNQGGHFKECATLEAYDIETDSWRTVTDAIDGVDASMRMFNFNDRLLFFGIDRESDSFAKFVLFDPEPLAEPASATPMDFSGASRSGDEAVQNARLLMRKDGNKDGQLSGKELGKRMAQFVELADADADGFVSFKEAVAQLKSAAQESAAQESAAQESAAQESAAEQDSDD